MKRSRMWKCVLVVFVILIVCTVLSACIEQLTMAEVTTVRAEGSLRRIPAEALVSDENGTHLYEVMEGEGWESGLRIYEIPAGEYQIRENGVYDVSGADRLYALSISKKVSDGDPVRIIVKQRDPETVKK